MEKRSRDQALTICQSYLQGSSRYSLTKQLNNVGELHIRLDSFEVSLFRFFIQLLMKVLHLTITGSRVDKHWFAIRDTTLKADRLLTLVPLSRNCPINVNLSMKETLNHLFLALQHPYICPVLDLDFKEFKGQNYVILVQPINQGSLKDLIYGVR